MCPNCLKNANNKAINKSSETKGSSAKRLVTIRYLKRETKIG